MKVIGYRTSRDVAAPHGEQIVHVAVLECGHWRRVSHGHVPTTLLCDEGCDDGREAQDNTPSKGPFVALDEAGKEP